MYWPIYGQYILSSETQKCLSTTKMIHPGYFSQYNLGLGRAKALLEIWPEGHGFWLSQPPDPSLILVGPIQPYIIHL